MTADELKAAGVQLEQTGTVELVVGYLVTHADGYEARFGPDRTRAELYAAKQHATLETMYVRRGTLPPLWDGPRRKIQVTVEVPADWESRLDMQWVLEREIHADRWSWDWPRSEPQEGPD